MKRTLFLLFGLVCTALMAFAAVHRHWDHVPAKDHARVNPVAGHADAIDAGALLYSEHCVQCHQADARGDGHKYPSLRSANLRQATDGDIEWFLRQGDLAHGMPSWAGLPRQQRWQLVAYLKSLQ